MVVSYKKLACGALAQIGIVSRMSRIGSYTVCVLFFLERSLGGHSGPCTSLLYERNVQFAGNRDIQSAGNRDVQTSGQGNYPP